MASLEIGSNSAPISRDAKNRAIDYIVKNSKGEESWKLRRRLETFIVDRETAISCSKYYGLQFPEGIL